MALAGAVAVAGCGKETRSAGADGAADAAEMLVAAPAYGVPVSTFDAAPVEASSVATGIPATDAGPKDAAPKK